MNIKALTLTSKSCTTDRDRQGQLSVKAMFKRVINPGLQKAIEFWSVRGVLVSVRLKLPSTHTLRKNSLNDSPFNDFPSNKKGSCNSAETSET